MFRIFRLDSRFRGNDIGVMQQSRTSHGATHTNYRITNIKRGKYAKDA
ncbi:MULTISPECIES: hypothetical protein [unclassified Rickettsia]|nr:MULTISPECIES: hypothetical protein [unclassified Rickettsia]